MYEGLGTIGGYSYVYEYEFNKEEENLVSLKIAI